MKRNGEPGKRGDGAAEMEGRGRGMQENNPHCPEDRTVNAKQ